MFLESEGVDVLLCPQAEQLMVNKQQHRQLCLLRRTSQ
jgi:hypothetical protein